MATILFRFRTQEQATGFMQGVEYVNDSSIVAHSFSTDDHEAFPFIITVEDGDADTPGERFMEQ